MEGVVLLIVAAYAAKIMIEDLSFAARGRPSPRQAIRLARANGQVGRRGGAFGRYLADVWADAWADASRRHHQRRERRQSAPPEARRPAGPARIYLRNRATDTRSAMSRRWAAGWQRAEARRQRRQQRVAATARPATAVAAPAASPATSELTGQLASADDTDTDTGGDSPQTPEAESSGTTTPAHPATEGDNDMSTPNGEVTGLRSAIGYSEELASEADHAVTALETLSAGLRSGGTGENTVGKFTAAGEHLGAAAGQLRDAARELSQHLSVTEAYEATQNEAGEKAFVTGD